MTALKVTIGLLCFLVIFLTYPPARADKLDWINPTARGNGTVYNAATDQGGANIWKNGQKIATTTGAANTWNSGSLGCTPISWQVSVFDKTLPPVGPLESPLSVAVLGPIDEVGCAPKSPGGVRVAVSAGS